MWVLLGDDDDGHALVDEGDGAVLHLGRRQSLGVDVAQLLELERALEGDRIVDAPAQVETVLALREPVRQELDLVVELECPGHFFWELVQLFQDLSGPRRRQVPPASHVDGHHGQHRDLRDKGLRAGNTDLRAHVQVDAGIRLTRNARSHGVDDPERRSSLGA